MSGFMFQNKTDYDAVIIGAGISGLVCGCFLAKAGMKVLITERNPKPGGYCTSFKRQGFTFDAAAHSFGGMVQGRLGQIFNELELQKKVAILRFNPSDTVTTPDYTITFCSEFDKTTEELKTAFPSERRTIQEFFDFIVNPTPLFLARIRSWTFLDLLNHHFKSNELKTILAFPLFGNAGLPPSRMSAFIAVKIFKEFLLDGGYYPEGGMQALSNALAERFVEFGGDLRLSHHVDKIKSDANGVTGVVSKLDGFIPSRCVISNCDARQTFFELLEEKERISREFFQKLNTVTQTLSSFIVYLGVSNASLIAPNKINLWYLSHYNLDRAYLAAQTGDFANMGNYLVHTAPEQNTISAYFNIAFKDAGYWSDNKDRLLESLIKKIDANTIPGLVQQIAYKGAATPQTLFRYTLNYKGAICGWENTPSQLAFADFRRPPFIKGLHLTGHWTTHGLGIPGVSYVGHDTAKLIIKKRENNMRTLTTY